MNEVEAVYWKKKKEEKYKFLPTYNISRYEYKETGNQRELRNWPQFIPYV